jgi:chaperone modulatory protein CbpM
VGRLIALGLLDAHTDPAGALVLPVEQVARAARIADRGSRSGLGLNYTAVGLVLDLLDRIDELETALRRRPNGRIHPGALEDGPDRTGTDPAAQPAQLPWILR